MCRYKNSADRSISNAIITMKLGGLLFEHHVYQLREAHDTMRAFI